MNNEYDTQDFLHRFQVIALLRNRQILTLEDPFFCRTLFAKLAAYSVQAERTV